MFSISLIAKQTFNYRFEMDSCYSNREIAKRRQPVIFRLAFHMPDYNHLRELCQKESKVSTAVIDDVILYYVANVMWKQDILYPMCRIIIGCYVLRQSFWVFGYFMLLIVPATFILAYYVKETIAGKIALLALLIIGFNLNISLIQHYNKIFENRKAIADFLRNKTPANEFIHLAGFGNQYI